MRVAEPGQRGRFAAVLGTEVIGEQLGDEYDGEILWSEVEPYIEAARVPEAAERQEAGGE